MKSMSRRLYRHVFDVDEATEKKRWAKSVCKELTSELPLILLTLVLGTRAHRERRTIFAVLTGQVAEKVMSEANWLG